MTDQHVAGKLKALAEDYERRAEKAAHANAAKAWLGQLLANVSAGWSNGSRKLAWRCSMRGVGLR